MSATVHSPTLQDTVRRKAAVMTIREITSRIDILLDMISHLKLPDEEMDILKSEAQQYALVLFRRRALRLA